MFLQIGNDRRIDNPTSMDIGHYLRNLPAEAPFLILDADDVQFIQATPDGPAYRVEWRQEAEQRFVILDVEQAEAAFAAFLGWDEAALNLLPWKRLTRFNDPHRRVALIAVAVLIAGLAGLYLALR